MTRAELVTRLVKRYRGMPLSLDDLTDLLGLDRKNVHVIVGSLVASGTIERFHGADGQVLVRDPIAWRDAA